MTHTTYPSAFFPQQPRSNSTAPRGNSSAPQPSRPRAVVPPVSPLSPFWVQRVEHGPNLAPVPTVAMVSATPLVAASSAWDGTPRRSRIIPVIVIAALTGGFITAMNYRSVHPSTHPADPHAMTSTPLPGFEAAVPAATPDSLPTPSRTTASRMSLPEPSTKAAPAANPPAMTPAKPAPSAKAAGDALVRKARPDVNQPASQVSSLPSNTPPVADPVNQPTPMPAPVTMPSPLTAPSTTPTPTTTSAPMAVTPTPSPVAPAATPAASPEKADQPAG